MFRERRKYPRVLLRKIPVKVETTLNNGRNLKKGMIKGISAGGIGISIQSPFKKNDVVALNFILDRGFRFRNIMGRIVRVENGLFNSIMGIEFINVSEDDVSRLTKYIDIRLKEKDKYNVIVQENMVIYK